MTETVDEFRDKLKEIRARAMHIPKKTMGQAIPTKVKAKKARSELASHRGYFKK